MTQGEARQGYLTLDGEGFRLLVQEGTRCIEQYVDAINLLNVFPVPDGDTGTNMLLTMQAALAHPELPLPGAGTVAEVSRAIARGALLGARGNSGVIFSQFLKGLAAGLDASTKCDGQSMGRALRFAADAAYQAVGTPVEGTMLTVLRAAAQAIDDSEQSLAWAWESAYRAAQAALAHTPEQLPVLKEAGVVDAGGQGVVAFMAGVDAFLSQRPDVSFQLAVPVDATPGASRQSVSQQFLEHTEMEMYGYCTSFVIKGTDLDTDQLRVQVNAMAASTAVVGDETVARVHAHVPDPGPLLSLGASLGSMEQIKIDNMDSMHQQFRERHRPASPSVPVGVVAVAFGEGLERVFQELGAAVVVRGGQTMNPSIGELIQAMKDASAEHVLLLPNNPNVAMAARQAQAEADGTCTVIPSRTIPQGIAALLAFNPGLEAEANVEAMTRALGDVRSGEVTVAVRDSTLDGVSVSRGQAIALLEGKLVAAFHTPNDALLELLDQAAPSDGALVTLYWGGDTDQATADSAAGEVRRRWQGVDVQVVPGGQPHYNYLVSIE